MSEDAPPKFWLPESARTIQPSANGHEDGFPRGGGIRMTMSIEQKVGLPNYGSASASIMLSGIPVWATPEMIDEALDTGRIVYDKMRERLVPRIQAIRASQGFTHEYGP